VRRLYLVLGTLVVLLAAACSSAVRASTPFTPVALSAATSWKSSHVTPPKGAVHSSLVGVSCTATTSCEAVGNYYTFSGVSQPFGEGWNGTAWTAQSMPMPSDASPFGVIVRSGPVARLLARHDHASPG
jgi:hypothetical protein